MTRIVLSQDHVTDLRSSIQRAKNAGYNSIICNIVNTQFQKEFQEEPMRSKHISFTRSDLILKSQDWIGLILKFSDSIQCDSKDENIRRISEKTLLLENNLAEHLAQYGFYIMKLDSGDCVNLARNVSANIKGTMLIQIPLTSPKATTLQYRSDCDETTSTNQDTWTWWNNFRSYSDFNSRIKVALELSGDIPYSEEIKRWLGEPVQCLIIPSSLFIINEKNYPVLPKLIQELIGAFVKLDIFFVVKASLEDPSLRYYSEYLQYLFSRYSKPDPMVGFDDLLEIPLQPLYDNLDSYTYEIFERDPVKYHLYQEAIELALIDKVPAEERESRTIIVMVVGAGRGPLVRAAINASAKTGVKIKIYVIEKNPNAVVTLKALVKEIWSKSDIEIISCDMRDFVPPEKGDILVSELLGSFGDNELSPECLDGAQKHLKDDGISIPCKSISYINPTMSSKLFQNVRSVEKSQNPRDRIFNYTIQSESSYVVYLKNIYHIGEPTQLFEFVHPNKEKNIDNSRFKTLQFEAKADAVIHGFSGYFEAILYKDVYISINPVNHTRGLVSWFPLYFPISEPQQIKAGQIIELNVWRCVGPHKVWYEYNTSLPHQTHIHNHGGRACFISK